MAIATVRHMVSGDPGRFRQIVTNLVGNAIKFTEKGHVLIDLSSTPSDSSEVMLTMRIEDTGIGIPEEKRASIFDKFSQVDTSSTRRHEGTGLGLAITAGLVDLFGGYIEVESTLGQGSVFTVRLPFTVVNERNKLQPLPINVKGARILVIDDNDINRRILTEQLALWGFDGLAVESGHAAMAILEEADRVGLSVDALIIDYQMPVMNGVDVARHYPGGSSFRCQIAIIFLTSMDMLGDERIFQELNVQAHLMKPARANLLRSAVIDVVRAARLRTHAGRFRGGCQPAFGCRRSRFARPRLFPSRSPPVQSCGIARKSERARVASACDVLIAEDNEVNQIVFRQIMQASEPDLSDRGKRPRGGRCMAVAFNPRLILMDVSMPVLNGHQAARTIREEERVAW